MVLKQQLNTRKMSELYQLSTLESIQFLNPLHQLNDLDKNIIQAQFPQKHKTRRKKMFRNQNSC